MRKVLFRIWPPYEFFVMERRLTPKLAFDDAWRNALGEATANVSQVLAADLDTAEKLAVSVYEAEIKRKDVLEAKAATFVVTPAVAAGITAGIAPLVKDLHLSLVAAGIVAGLYALALIHLLVSSWYAVAARRAEAFVHLSARNAQDLMLHSQADRIAERLAYTALNEPALTRKANRLSVAEDLFLRGLAFLAAGALLTILAHMADL